MDHPPAAEGDEQDEQPGEEAALERAPINFTVSKMSGECMEVTMDKKDTVLDLMRQLAIRDDLPIWSIKLVLEAELLTDLRQVLADLLCSGSPVGAEQGASASDAVPCLDLSMIIQSVAPPEAIRRTKAFVDETNRLLPNTFRYYIPRANHVQTLPYRACGYEDKSRCFQKNSHTRASRKQRERHARDLKRGRRRNALPVVAAYYGPRTVEHILPAQTSSIRLGNLWNFPGILNPEATDALFIDVDFPSRESGGLIHWALQRIRGPALLPVISRLLDARARVDQPDQGGRTLLHVACSLGRGALGKLLLERKADGNARCSAGKLPLQYAMHHCLTRIPEDVRVEDDGKFMQLACDLMDMAPVQTDNPTEVARLKLCRATVRKVLLSRLIRFEQPRLKYEFERQLWRGWPLSFLSFQGALTGPGDAESAFVEPAFAAARRLSLAQMEMERADCDVISNMWNLPQRYYSMRSHWSYYSDSYFSVQSFCGCRRCRMAHFSKPTVSDRAFVEDYDEYKSWNLKWRDSCNNDRQRTRVPFPTRRGGRLAYSAKLARKLPTKGASKARGPNWQESRRTRRVAWSQADAEDFAEDWWRE